MSAITPKDMSREELEARVAELERILARARKWCEEHGDTRHQWYADAAAALQGADK